MNRRRTLLLVSIVLCLSALLFSSTSCTPTARVEVAAPEKPITINLNVKIDHEVRVKVEKELDQILSEDSDLF
ncbi:YnbE family lipoprotein [Nitrospira sp. M1]